MVPQLYHRAADPAADVFLENSRCPKQVWFRNKKFPHKEFLLILFIYGRLAVTFTCSRDASLVEACV